MTTQIEKNELAMQLISIQKLFSSLFPQEVMQNTSSSQGTEYMDNSKSASNQHFASQSAEFIDLSKCMDDTEVTVPTLNG